LKKCSPTAAVVHNLPSLLTLQVIAIILGLFFGCKVKLGRNVRCAVLDRLPAYDLAASYEAAPLNGSAASFLHCLGCKPKVSSIFTSVMKILNFTVGGNND